MHKEVKVLTEKERKEAVLKLGEAMAAYQVLYGTEYTKGKAPGIDRAVRVLSCLYPNSPLPNGNSGFVTQDDDVLAFVANGGSYDMALSCHTEFSVYMAIKKAKTAGEPIRKEMAIVEVFCKSRLNGLIDGLIPIIRGV